MPHPFAVAKAVTPFMSDTPDIPETPQAPHRDRRSRAAARSIFHIEVPEGRARIVAIVAAVVAGVLALAIVFDVVATQGRIHPGVHVGDVAVGSMMPADARTKLVTAFTSGARTPVTAVYKTTKWTVTAEQIGVRVDATASIDAAMEVGRTGGAFEMLGQRIGAIFGGVGIPLLVNGDAEKAAAVLDEISKATAVAARDASVTVSGTSVALVKGAPGRRLDRERTLAAISTAFVTSARTGAVAVVDVPVAVADQDAQQALTDARELVSGPATIAYDGKATAYPQQKVARWVVFTRVPVITPAIELSSPATASADATASGPMRLVAGFDAARIGSTIATLTHGIGRPARDARFVAEKGHVKVVASQVGRGPDLSALANDLARACVGGGARTATLRLAETQPKLTTEAARAMGVSDRISTYTTTYAATNPARVSNVHTLARALDYKLVPPGGIFSFNGTAGQRTAAKGYQEAPAIVNGKLVPQLGGGVCQVGSTIFNTVFFAGLPVVERRNHSFYISHYPTGRDATVSWGGPDFKFKNDTEGWLLIRTAYTDTSLTIALYGTDPGYTVRYKTGPFTNVVPHKVVEVKDSKLAKGVRVVEDTGVDGRRVTVTRTVYKGTEVIRKDTFVSNYKSKDEIIRVGTKASSRNTTDTVSP